MGEETGAHSSPGMVQCQEKSGTPRHAPVGTNVDFTEDPEIAFRKLQMVVANLINKSLPHEEKGRTIDARPSNQMG